MLKGSSKRRKITEKPSDKLTDEEKKEIKEFLRSQAKIIIEYLQEESKNV